MLCGHIVRGGAYAAHCRALRAPLGRETASAGVRQNGCAAWRHTARALEHMGICQRRLGVPGCGRIEHGMSEVLHCVASEHVRCGCAHTLLSDAQVYAHEDSHAGPANAYTDAVQCVPQRPLRWDTATEGGARLAWTQLPRDAAVAQAVTARLGSRASCACALRACPRA